MKKLIFLCFLVPTLVPNVAMAQLSVVDGLQLWLDATDSSTVFQDTAMSIPAVAGAPVAGWADKSGNDYHAMQADAAITPSYNMTGLSGLPTIRFDGAEADGLAISESLVLERPYSVFVVNQYNDVGEARGRGLQGLDSNWLHGLWNGTSSSFAGGFIGANLPAETLVPYVIDTTGTPDGDSTLFMNGLDITTNSTPAGSPGRLGIAGVGLFPAEVSDADVSELLVYDRVLSDDELGSVRDYLYGKYNPTSLQPPVPLNTVNFGSVGSFTGGDAGEGLNLSGNFRHAINVGGPETAVGSVTFTDGSEEGMSSPGATITDANEIAAWHAAEYGDSAADDGLEAVMASIRWNVQPGLELALDVEEGSEYELQLLFAENCCDRGFDILIEGELAVDNFSIPSLQGGTNETSAGAFFSHTFVAGDDTLDILLGGSNPLASDNNAILNGVTVRTVPEPNGLGLIALGLLGLLGIRRKR